MTTREAYVAVIEKNLTDEVIEKFETLVANLDASNEKKREKAAEKKELEEKGYDWLIKDID